MHYAFLEKTPVGLGSNPNQLMLVQSFTINPKDKVALLKARTLLAFLHEEDALNSLESADGQWIIYYGPKEDAEALKAKQIPSSMNKELAGMIVIDHNAPSAKQPAMAIIRNDIVTTSVFFQSFLDSSKRWLHKHDDERVKLKTEYQQYLK